MVSTEPNRQTATAEDQKENARRNIRDMQTTIIQSYEEFGDQIHNLVDILLEIREGKEVVFNSGYDLDGIEDVQTLLSGKDIGDGSRVMMLGKIYGHYDANTGIINIGWYDELSEG